MAEQTHNPPVNNRNELLRFSRSYAFVIGINYYPDINANLISAVPDAREMARILKYRQGFDEVELLLGVSPEADREVLAHGLDEVLITYEATGAVLTSLLRRIQQLGENRPEQDKDCIVFYFAGHGKAGDFDEGPKGYLLPTDAQPQHAALKNDSLIPMDQVFTALQEANCHHTLLILDCCFAGKFRYIGQKTRDVDELFFMPMYEERFERFKRGRAWQVLVSAGPHQTAADWMGVRSEQEEGVHSPFARALIQALEGKAEVKPAGKNLGDGVLTSQELFLYLWNKVEGWTNESPDFHIQYPDLFPMSEHEGGQFIFFDPDNVRNFPEYKPRNPYKGLQSFDATDSDLLFGRKKVVNDLIKKISSTRLLLVTGPSGSGKSSVVKAGLFPALQARDNAWNAEELIVFRPGAKPHQEFLEITARLDPAKKQLLLIDQYEALFIECTDEQEQRDFEGFLIELFNRTGPEGMKIVLTLRSDFEWQLEASDFGRSFWDREDLYTFLYRIPPMSLDELREALVAPAWVEAYDFESEGLINFILEEVSYAPGALPLLSFTMSELYRITPPEDNRIFQFTRYKDELGGVNGALSNRADAIYKELPDDAHRRIMKNLLLRMAQLNDGSYTRRRVYLSGPGFSGLNELDYEQDEDDIMIRAVLENLIKANLVISDTDSLGQAYVEPLHDSLINFWPRCLQWIKAFGRENLILQRQLWQAVLDREKQETDLEQAGFRNTVRQVTAAEVEASKQSGLSAYWEKNPKLFQVIGNLLEAGHEIIAKKEANAAASQALAEIENSLDKEEKENFSTLLNHWHLKAGGLNLDAFTLSGATGPLLEVLFRYADHGLNSAEIDFIRQSWAKRTTEILTLKKERDEAIRARDLAEQKTKEALAGVLASKAQMNYQEDQTLAFQQAYQAFQTFPTDEAARILDIISSNPGSKFYKTTAADERQLIAGSFEKHVLPRVIKSFCRSQKAPSPGSYEKISNQVGFSGNGEKVLTTGGEEDATLWSIGGEEIHTFQGCISAALCRQQDLILVGDKHQAVLYDFSGRALREFKGLTTPLVSVAISVDGKYILAGSQSEVMMWDRDGNQLLKLQTEGPSTVIIADDNSHILATYSDNLLRNKAFLWSFKGQQRWSDLNNSQLPPLAPAFSPGVPRYFLIGKEGGAGLIELQSKGFTQHHIPVHTRAAAFSPDQKYLLIAGTNAPKKQDGSIDMPDKAGLWDISSRKRIYSFIPPEEHLGYLDSLAFSPTGHKFLLGYSTGISYLVDNPIWQLENEQIDPLHLIEERISFNKDKDSWSKMLSFDL